MIRLYNEIMLWRLRWKYWKELDLLRNMIEDCPAYYRQERICWHWFNRLYAQALSVDSWFNAKEKP